MKKFISILAIAVTMFAVNASVANAQNWDDFNYKLAKTHTTEYIEKGDDAYRMGRYNEAMNHYKQARYYNDYKGHTVIPAYEIDRKMDRCADAMRNGRRSEPARRDRDEKISDGAALAVIGGALLGGIIASAVSNNKAKKAEVNTGSLIDVRYNGLSYQTTNANKSRILSIRNEFDYTVVELEYYDTNDNHYLSINRDTYLKDNRNGSKYSLIDADNISVKNSTYVAAGRSHTFRLYFERLSSNSTDIDLIEPGTSSWKFYHVPVRNY